MPLHYEDVEVRISKVDHMGPINNNGYILTCKQTGETVIIDAPAEPGKAAEGVGRHQARVKAIIITHRHGKTIPPASWR